MKKFYIGMLLSLLFIGNVNAQEIYYKNSNDVSFTKDEYNKISDFYWEGYQDYISVDDFEFLKNNGLFDNEITTVEINDSKLNMLSLAEHTTANKSLKMKSVCTTNCLVSINLNWINLPKIRSYDILGVYFDNTSLINAKSVIIDTNNGVSSHAFNIKNASGIGTSFKLPTSVTYLNISQTLTVEKKGSIKASYQHAKKSISYANSQKYTFNKAGIGGVFQFYKGIQDYYDCMLGVSSNLI